MDLCMSGRRWISIHIYIIIYRLRNNPKGVKNASYELFKPFDKDNPTSSFFVNDVSLSVYLKKILAITNKVFIKSVIINTSNSGKIQVLINIENIDDDNK